MATLRQRLRMQASDGTYNTVHLETTADHVLMPDGSKLSDRLNNLKDTIDTLAMSSGLTHALGDVFTWANYTWRTVHVTNEYEYAILHTGIEKVQFGFSNVYVNSTIANKCEEFLATISATDQELLADITVCDVTCKVFIPTYDQVSGGFTWLAEKENRASILFPDLTESFTRMGNAHWWTCTPIGDGVYYVSSDGTIGNNTSTASNVRFRPCIAFLRGEATVWRC